MLPHIQKTGWNRSVGTVMGRGDWMRYEITTIPVDKQDMSKAGRHLAYVDAPNKRVAADIALEMFPSVGEVRVFETEHAE